MLNVEHIMVLQEVYQLSQQSHQLVAVALLVMVHPQQAKAVVQLAVVRIQDQAVQEILHQFLHLKVIMVVIL